MHQKRKIWTAYATDVARDGTCMFHSVGKPLRMQGESLRTKVCDIIEQYADSSLHGITLRQWVEWDGSASIDQYIKRMRQRMWGGAFELSILSAMLGIPLFVYSAENQMCKRITEVRPDDALHSSLRDAGLDIETTKPNISLLYVGKSHYMSLATLRE